MISFTLRPHYFRFPLDRDQVVSSNGLNVLTNRKIPVRANNRTP